MDLGDAARSANLVRRRQQTQMKRVRARTYQHYSFQQKTNIFFLCSSLAVLWIPRVCWGYEFWYRQFKCQQTEPNWTLFMEKHFRQFKVLGRGKFATFKKVVNNKTDVLFFILNWKWSNFNNIIKNNKQFQTKFV